MGRQKVLVTKVRSLAVLFSAMDWDRTCQFANKQDKRGKDFNILYCLNNVVLSELCIDINGEKPQVHELFCQKV